MNEGITHAYVHWLADVHLAVFAPAFTLSFHDSECSRKPPVPIASVVRLRKNLRLSPTQLLAKNTDKRVKYFLLFYLRIPLKMLTFMQLNKNTALCTTLKANPEIKCKSSVWNK